jgi:hypothetical protein
MRKNFRRWQRCLKKERFRELVGQVPDLRDEREGPTLDESLTPEPNLQKLLFETDALADLNYLLNHACTGCH